MFTVGSKSSRLWGVFLFAAIVAGCGSGGGSGGAPAAGGTAPPAGGGGAPTPAALAISGAPAPEIPADVTYCFVPTVSGESGTVSFSISGLPAWASFDDVTGKLQGRPGSGDIGNHGGIVISADDSSATASLAAFGISVINNAPGSVTLSWTAPTETTDGASLTDLAGYRIYYGNEQDCFVNSETINNPGVVTHVVGNLSAGNWYFAVTAFVSSGNESGYSNIVSRAL